MNSAKRPFNLLTVSALSLLLAGCVVGPEYSAPVQAIPDAWSKTVLDSQVHNTASDPETLASWWTAFDDPTLNTLMFEAINNNPDRDQALARIREARARFQISRADTRPTVTAGASTTAVESADFLGDVDWRGTYETGVDASWELDLFGGVRRANEVAQATLQAREAEYIDVMTSLVAEVAFTYVELRTLEERIRLTQASIVAQEETVQLIRWRTEVGLASALDFEQAQSNLDSTRAQIPLLERDRDTSRNALSFLTGKVPGALDEHLAVAGQIPAPPSALAIGIPADALRQRGDVRAAERNLAAQSARIGVAEANRYPTIRLNGAISASASDVSGLFDDVSRVASLGPSLTTTLFDAGRLAANVAVEDALYEQAVSSFERTVLNALRETEDALVARQAAQRRVDSLGSAVTAAERARDLAAQEYDAGLTDFDRVLEAERTVLSLQEQFALNQSGETQAVISVYKAIGGGWAAADMVTME